MDKIIKFSDLEDTDGVSKQLEEIFFANHPGSDFQAFVGTYYQDFPDHFFIALEGEVVTGYLAICPDTKSFIKTSFFEYYQAFVDLYEDHPAHLHINIRQSHQGLGVGSKLLAHAKKEVEFSLHTITYKDDRNVDFYLKNKFSIVTVRDYKSKALIFLSNQ